MVFMENDSSPQSKREQKAKSFRLLQIEQLIKNLNYPNVPRLMKETGKSRATIMRDIETLMDDYSAPIEYDYFHKGYHYTDETYFVRNVMISESELIAIAGLLPLLERYKNTPMEESIQKVYGTLSDMLPNQIQVQAAIANNVQFISEAIPRVDPEVFSEIFKAIRNNREINFGYRSISAVEHTPHTAQPYRIYNQKGDWYVICYYPKKEYFSTFTLSRMKDVQLGQEFKPNPNFEKEVHIDPNFGIWNNDNPPVKIELLFDKSINTYILERTWHKKQEIRQNPDGSVYLSFESNQTQEVLFWIMKFGAQVEVLAPESLRDEVLSQHKKAVEKYESAKKE